MEVLIFTGLQVATDVKRAIERNQQREGVARVPSVALYSTVARIVPPTFEEGFNRVYCVQIAEYSTRAAPVWVVEEMGHGYG